MNPILINYFIVLVFTVAAVMWATVPNWGQVLYWTGGVILTIGVTLMAK